MKKILFTYFLFFISFSLTYATHNRAGEITYRQISDMTYEVKILIYTNSLSAADRRDIEIQWGDDTQSVIPRSEIVFLPNYYKRNKYIGIHTFPGPGTYVLVVEDPNRNLGVQNIPNSVNVVFSIKTIMRISDDIGFNNTPVLTTPPIDKAAVGKLFIHNPGAFDPDGDSLSYKLTQCTGENGQEIPGYTFPQTSNAFYVNEITGDLVWDTPVQDGVYNVAMFIEEWRNGVRIGKIERDMQIDVYDVNNNPPVLVIQDKYCIEADSVLHFLVSASDPDNEQVTLTATGGPFLIDNTPAHFEQNTTGSGTVSTYFTWMTNCYNVREQPYQVIFKAQDNNPELQLVSQKNVNIYIIGPAPKNLQLTPTNNSIAVHWDVSNCDNVKGYKVYRKTGSSDFVPDVCQTGVPFSTGFKLIAEMEGLHNTTFIDNNIGLGLMQGYNYCYRVTACFADGAEGYSSVEVCSDLIRGIPVITNVSINNTDSLNGSVYLAWAKPTELDTLPSNPNGPYKYLIYRSFDLWGTNLALIDSLDHLEDTTYVDTLINTKSTPISYKIELYNDSTGKRFLIGAPGIASSVFADPVPDDNKIILNIKKNIPWHNLTYTIYRQNELTLNFDSIGFTENHLYVDSGLANEKLFCYKIKSSGMYPTGGFVDPIINFSQITCIAPADTSPPCTPELQVVSVCDSLRNELSWTNPNSSCADDVISYNIYYSPLMDVEPVLIKNIQPAWKTSWEHYPSSTMAGCYHITAVDSFLNESPKSLKICIDNCSFYKLPNIFTPNDDGINDLFVPVESYFVEKVDMKIYNRWGMLVFSTDDPQIKWDGRNAENKRRVSSGVYYYVCDVYEKRLTGLEHRTITGFVQVMAEDAGTKLK